MLIGNNVVLRAVEKEDLQQFYKWSNDPQLKKLYSCTMGFCSFDEIVQNYETNIETRKNVEFVILDKSEKQPIGRCMLTDIDLINKKCMCTVYIIDEESKINGYGLEAMELLMKYAFKDLNLNRVGALAFDFNKEAIRCCKNCGMKVEGIIREGIYRDGKYHDIYFMGILKQEYEEIESGGDDACFKENL